MQNDSEIVKIGKGLRSRPTGVKRVVRKGGLCHVKRKSSHTNANCSGERLNSGTQWGKPNGFPFRPKAKGGKPLALEETNIF